MKAKYTTLILIAIIIAGLIVRNLYSSNLLFGFEQGRDFSVAGDIASFKKFTLIGPKTDIDGIYHGAFYYYFLAALFQATSGNPYTIAFIFTIINSLTGLIVYKTCLLLFKDRYWGLIGMMLATFSFNLIIYSRWISNVSPAIPIFAAFYYFILKAINYKNGKHLSSAVFFGFLLLHFEILSIIPVLTTTILAIILYRIKPKLKNCVLSVLAILFNIFPFLLFEIKHQFLLVNGIKGYFALNHTQKFNLAGNLKNYFIGINTEISSAIFPSIHSAQFLWIIFIIIIFLVIFFKSTKNNRLSPIFLFLSIFGTFPLFVFLKYSSLEQFFVGASIPIIIFFVFALQAIHKNMKTPSKSILILVFIIIIIYNIFYTIKNLNSRDNIFYYTSQKEVAIGKKIKVIKYMQSFHEKYSFDAFTTPLYRPDGWHYLNTWLNKDNQYDSPQVQLKNFFTVIEPFTEKHWLELWLKKYNNQSVQEKSITIDGIIIQKRKKI